MRQQIEKLLLTISGGFVLLYCIVVIAFVATVPDLRLRVLLVDAEIPSSKSPGVVIRDTPGMNCIGLKPVAGDFLLKVGGQPVGSFVEFVRANLNARRTTITPGSQLKLGEDPTQVGETINFQEREDGERLAKVEFQHGGDRHTSWVTVQSQPISEMLLTLLWFLLQLGISAVGAIAVWNRPFDRPARLFFAMCIVTLGAFVGGFHWWVISGSLWLNIPFVGCALLVPVVSLHFFLTYPRRVRLLVRYTRPVLFALYLVPAIAFLRIVGLWFLAQWAVGDGVINHNEVATTLTALNHVIYLYLTFAVGCFAVMLMALANGYLRTANQTERSQLKWMFWGGVLAAAPVSYTLYLALFDRVEFAIGRARFSMFLASLAFMLAYSVAILRYKLMLIDQIISKGMRYYAASCGLSVSFAGFISLSGLTANFWNSGEPVFPGLQQSVVLGAVLAVAVLTLLWGRDRLQQFIDLRFYREKYQLDKALQRINRAVEHVVDRDTLARRMIASCRDVLRVERIGVYLRDPGRVSFSLIAVEEGGMDWPSQIVADAELMEALQQESALTRSGAPLGGGLSSAQQLLRSLRAELVFAFEGDGELAGLVVLGPKQGGVGYTAEDLTFLNALGQITSVALHSVKVHQDISRLNEELQLKVEKIDEQRRVITMLQREIRTAQDDEPQVAEKSEEEFQRGAIRGDSPAIRRVLETVRKVATSESSVLINGASGTGKELLAHAIHVNSPRRQGPMVSVHCAALSPGLLESELFGHAKGAFTGAHKDRVGRFELANGGTLFLDEIGDISLETQVKLLRVLQTRQFEPVGSTRTINVDVRLITATHQDLRKLIREGKFREDLFYRLNVINIELPTLAERKEDILELSMHFLNQASERLGKRITHIDDLALDVLKRHTWPGNIRELENVIERAVVLADGDSITKGDLPPEILISNGESSKLPPSPNRFVEQRPLVSNGPKPQNRVAKVAEKIDTTSIEHDEFTERESLQRALAVANGNKAEAARILGIPRSTLFSKLRKYRINKPR